MWSLNSFSFYLFNFLLLLDSLSNFSLYHEKNNGTGFPHRLSGDKISIYAQMCQIIEEFDNLYYEYTEYTQLRFDYTLNKIMQETGAIRYEVCNLFKGCKYEIIEYYQKFHSVLPVLCEG